MADSPQKQKLQFIGIGAQKAGTTWLFARLRELSQFSLPYVKEFHYFDRSPAYPSPNHLAEERLGSRVSNIKWTSAALFHLLKTAARGDARKLRWLYRWYFSDYNDHWYLSLFESLPGISGEITPAYSILGEEDVSRMYELLPDVKLIFLIRNPVERAWSHFRHNVKMKKLRGLDTGPTDEDSIIAFFEEAEQDLRSDYKRTLEVYSRIFPKEQLLIGFYDAIIEQPGELLSGIVSYLGGDPALIEQESNMEGRNNVSPKMNIPSAALDFLNEKYTPMLKDLSELLGGYCTRWYKEVAGGTVKGEDGALPPAFTFLK